MFFKVSNDRQSMTLRPLCSADCLIVRVYALISAVIISSLCFQTAKSFAEAEPICKVVPPDAFDGFSLAEARAKVSEAFGSRIGDASDKASQIAVVESVLSSAAETTPGTADHYALIEFAWLQSFKLSDVDRVLNIAAKLDQSYPAMNQRGQIATVCCFLQSRLSTVDRTSVSVIGLSLAKESLRRVDFDQFNKLIKCIKESAERLRDREVLVQCEELQATADQVRMKFDEYSTAKIKIELGMGDPESYETAGLFRCLWLGDWQEGIRLLRSAKTQSVIDIAERESGVVDDGELATKWSKLSDELSPVYRESALARALHYYKRALPTLKGLDKVLFEQRIAKIESQLDGSMRSSDPLRDLMPGTWVTAFPLSSPEFGRYWKPAAERNSKTLLLSSTPDVPAITTLGVDLKDLVVSCSSSLTKKGRFYIELRTSHDSGLSFVANGGGSYSFGYFKDNVWKRLKDLRHQVQGGEGAITVAVVGSKMTAWVDGQLVGSLSAVPINESGFVRIGTSDGGVAEINQVKLLIPSREQIDAWKFD